jgi:hypothetical protein
VLEHQANDPRGAVPHHRRDPTVTLQVDDHVRMQLRRRTVDDAQPGATGRDVGQQAVVRGAIDVDVGRNVDRPAPIAAPGRRILPGREVVLG